MVNLRLYLFFIIGGATAHLDIGDPCILRSTGEQGTCKELHLCDEARRSLHIYHRFPQTCGRRDTQTIVCCADQEPMITETMEEIITMPPPESMSQSLMGPGAISKQKCREYGEYVYVIRPNPSLSDDAEQFVKRYECGFKVEPLIIGGTRAKVKEFPHQAMVGYEGTPGHITWECGGSLISKNYILTAGHCLFSRENGEAKYVRMGILEVTDTRAMQIRNVVERLRHPEFRPPSHYNDVALLKTDADFDLNPYVRPACLFTDFNIPTEKAIATGWGKKNFTDKVGSDHLLKVTLEFYDIQECSKYYKNHIGTRRLKDGIRPNTQICAGWHTADRDTCQGDSGGPLQIYHQDKDVRCMYDIIGVTSFGQACGLGHNPGIYTRVSSFIAWIESTVWPDIS